jgi:hypothetical protein
MIRNLTGTNGITVTGGTAHIPYINQNPNNPIVGMLRINGSDMQVFDGNNWINFGGSYATVELDQDTKSLLSWARMKQQQEIDLLELATKNKAVEIALINVKKAQEQLTITAHLAKEEYETTS